MGFHLLFWLKNMTLTPKKDFRENKALSQGWSDFVSSPQFEAAAKAALLELQFANMTGLQPAENAFRLHGAQQFLDILMRLTDSPEIPIVSKTQLNYGA